MKEKLEKECEYCSEIFYTTNNKKRFCCDVCRVYQYRYNNELQCNNYQKECNDLNVTILEEKAKLILSKNIYGNSVAEIVLKCIRLGHFKKISSNDVKYILKK